MAEEPQEGVPEASDNSPKELDPQEELSQDPGVVYETDPDAPLETEALEGDVA